MTAQEMFEKLGYKLTRNIKEFISYEFVSSIGLMYSVEFCLEEKWVEVMPKFKFNSKKTWEDDYYENFVRLAPDLIKAITQQMKELKWL